MRMQFNSVAHFFNSREGEEFVAVTHAADQPNVLLTLIDSGQSVSIDLDPADLSRMVDVIDRIRAKKPGSLTLEGEIGDTLHIRQNVWGEPYDEGLAFEACLGDPCDYDTPRLSVGLVDWTCDDLLKLLKTLSADRKPDLNTDGPRP